MGRFSSGQGIKEVLHLYRIQRVGLDRFIVKRIPVSHRSGPALIFLVSLLTEFERHNSQYHANDGYNPEPHGYFAFMKSFFLIVMM